MQRKESNYGGGGSLLSQFSHILLFVVLAKILELPQPFLLTLGGWYGRGGPKGAVGVGILPGEAHIGPLALVLAGIVLLIPLMNSHISS